jgi:hypothetical protein
MDKLQGKLATNAFEGVRRSEKMFCDMCSQSFSLKRSLIDHVKRVHLKLQFLIATSVNFQFWPALPLWTTPETAKRLCINKKPENGKQQTTAQATQTHLCRDGPSDGTLPS